MLIQKNKDILTLKTTEIKACSLEVSEKQRRLWSALGSSRVGPPSSYGTLDKVHTCCVSLFSYLKNGDTSALAAKGRREDQMTIHIKSCHEVSGCHFSRIRLALTICILAGELTLPGPLECQLGTSLVPDLAWGSKRLEPDP